MDIQSLEAFVSLIVTLLPIALAVAGTAFGVRLRRRAASTKEATVAIIKFAHEPEMLAAQKQRRQIQFFDIGLWLVLFAIFALLAVFRTSEFVLLPPMAALPRFHYRVRYHRRHHLFADILDVRAHFGGLVAQQTGRAHPCLL